MFFIVRIALHLALVNMNSEELLNVFYMEWKEEVPESHGEFMEA